MEEITAISEEHSVHTQNLKETVKDNNENIMQVSEAIVNMKDSVTQSM